MLPRKWKIVAKKVQMDINKITKYNQGSSILDHISRLDLRPE